MSSSPTTTATAPVSFPRAERAPRRPGHDRRLCGRHDESTALDRLIAGARSGRSGVLVIRGDAGIGKTVLLDGLAERAAGCRVARATAVACERELPFAGLHQLCAPFLDRCGRLSQPHAEALGAAFGLRAGEPPSRFMVGLAVLALLADVADDAALICLVDDAQWLDRVSAQTLAFVARRLRAERVAMVFAVREPSDERDLTGLPEIVLGGLTDGAAEALLESVLRGPVDAQVRDQIVAEARGNPFALLALTRGRTPAELAGGFGLADATPTTSRLEHALVRELALLPSPTRRLLVTAAVEPLGDVTLLWRALERQGIDSGALHPAEAAGLIELGARVRFRHPVVRSAVWRSAAVQEIRDAHGALADVTDPECDPDRRAWHRARAVAGPDEAVAAELERAVGRARARGGVAAAAAFLERAAELTADAPRRAARALAAAEAKFDAAAPDAASALLVTADPCSLEPQLRARLERLRAKETFARVHGTDTALVLLDTARRLEALDVRFARETYLEAIAAGIYAGRAHGGRLLREVAQAARSAPVAPSPPRAVDLLLDGLALRFTDGYAAGVPLLRAALQAFAREHGRDDDGVRWIRLAAPIAEELDEGDASEQLISRTIACARETGALAVLPIALAHRAGAHMNAGELAAASALADEADAIYAATGNPTVTHASLMIAAYRGQEALVPELIAGRLEPTANDDAVRSALAGHAKAVLYNGVGRYEDARAAAYQACEYQELGAFGWALVELIEAGARSGYVDVAGEALPQLRERTAASGTDLALGMEARSRALLAGPGDAEALYLEALIRLASGRLGLHRARAELVYGEWLRREGRRKDARDQLRRAHDTFSQMGALGFAERARRELLATGETARRRSVDTRTDLTAQEAEIARLAGDGHTNPEIAAQLFISSRTVEWHLRKVFTKLGITSRRELRRTPPASGTRAALAI